MPELPDTAKWQPRKATETLEGVFAKRCLSAEERLLLDLRYQRNIAVDGFDSGLPFESAVRREIGNLLPNRYSVTKGHVLDRAGNSAGDCDIAIFNGDWCSTLEGELSGSSAKTLLPIEGVYAIGEVKQTLSSKTLDEAMEKLVSCQRLRRPRTFAHRLVENREGDSCPHGLTNPLFSFVIAGGVSTDIDLKKLIDRFFDISKQLSRLELVRVLCVLGQGAVSWAFFDPDRRGELRPALFMEADLFHPIIPVLSQSDRRSPFLFLIQALQQSLFHIVLGPEDLAYAYSLDARGIGIPTDPHVVHLPDKEWLDSLLLPCSVEHK
ncbi:MAG TPA: hypothetical protein PLR41_00455 [Alphaproteobacteria bacterium]|nr:hypothetical protein [Alphaproteobacteria bacterium]